MTTANNNRPDVDAIIGKGAYYVLGDYAERGEILDKFNRAFLDGIAQIAGQDCRDKVAADGPGQLHRHFPIAKIHLLEAHLKKALHDDLYHWSYRVGSETLGLADPFYVDHLVVFRIHYPHLQARKAKDIESAPYPWGERLRLAAASLRNPHLLGNYFAKKRETKRAYAENILQFDPFAYHGKMPVAARSHGPHVDTWYGHSYDGINLWLAIDGVNEDNTVILYPDMFGRPVKFDPVSMYLAPGVAVSKPVKVVPGPGELLVFNPETLHGTQVNISEETRVALTTRINPGRPRFAPRAPFHFEYWYSSEDLKRRRFSAMKVFPSTRNQGEPSITEGSPYVDETTRRLSVAGKLAQDPPLAVCAADELKAGEKLAVDLENAKVLLWRDGTEIRAYSRTCPHVGVDLADGSHDEGRIFCPGHGIAFSLKDGSSRCSSYRLKAFRAYEADGRIFVARQPAAAEIEAAE